MGRGSGGSSFLRLRRTASGQSKARTGAAPDRERPTDRPRRLLQQPRRKSAAGQPDWLEGTLNKHPRARERGALCQAPEDSRRGCQSQCQALPGKPSPALGGEAMPSQAPGGGGGATNACARQARKGRALLKRNSPRGDGKEMPPAPTPSFHTPPLSGSFFFSFFLTK